MAANLSRLEVEAHAKINLTLEIIGKRDDGYHDISSIMQTVDLHDSVILTSADDITLSCDDSELCGDDNLALVAARTLREHAGSDRGVAIELKKRIPVSAGLGGGSSDAAAVLNGLNELWELGLGGAELEEVGARVGSDVPYLINGGTALVQGRGEHVVPLPHANIVWMVIVAPETDLRDKTARMFSEIKESDHTRGLLTHKLAGRIRGGGDAPAQFFFNAFEPYADRVFPDYSRVRELFHSRGAMGILMTGAGPSMFAVAPSREIGLAWQLMLEMQHGLRAYLVRRWDPPASTRVSTRRAHVSRDVT